MKIQKNLLVKRNKKKSNKNRFKIKSYNNISKINKQFYNNNNKNNNMIIK